MAHREQFDILITDRAQFDVAVGQNRNTQVNRYHNIYAVDGQRSSPAQLSTDLIAYRSKDNLTPQRTNWYGNYRDITMN
jgi:hypothetical protein